MDAFSWRDGQLFCSEVAVDAIAKETGTPVYIYSGDALLRRYRELVDAFAEAEPLACYSVKSCSNLAVLRLLKDAGSGFDVVSGGELYRVRQVGADMQRVVFAGVGKQAHEIRDALEAGILMFNVESASELALINQIAAELGRNANVALRVNPDVDPRTHRYTTTGKLENKFGIDLETAARLIANAAEFSNVTFAGVHCHIGSPILDPAAYEEALTKAIDFMGANRSDAAPLHTLNMGGGFGIQYGTDAVPTPGDYAARILPIVKRANVRFLMEPGRYIAGNSGVLLVGVTHIKDNGVKTFVITDGAMNDLIRPALYGSHHEVWPTQAAVPPVFYRNDDTAGDLQPVDIVGPVCESGDFFGQARPLPEVATGDRLAIFSAGAYGFVMASNYNSRPRPPEVLVEGESWTVVRRREQWADLIREEKGLDA